MASTLTPYRAFDYAKQYIKQMSLENVGAPLLDDVNKIMWMAAPWRWTLGSMPTVTLTAGTQDYSVAAPSDYLYLVNAYLTDGITANRPLKIEPTLPTNVGLKGNPSRVAFITSVPTALRVSPLPGSVLSPAPTLISLYKKQAPTITKTNMNTAGVQVFDDEWFWVFQEGVLWRAYLYGDDSRAGSVQMASNGQIQYTGQQAVFQAGLQFMRENEKMPVFESDNAEEQK